jgi:hypothetical protein
MPAWGNQPISVHAQRDLARWQDIARAWPLEHDQPVDRCGQCGQAAVRTHDDHGRPYQITEQDRLTQIVAHLRQCHETAILDP